MKTHLYFIPAFFMLLTACEVEGIGRHKDGGTYAWRGSFLQSSKYERHGATLNGVGSFSSEIVDKDETSVAKMGIGAWGVAKAGAQKLATTKSNNARDVKVNESNNAAKIASEKIKAQSDAIKNAPQAVAPEATVLNAP